MTYIRTIALPILFAAALAAQAGAAVIRVKPAAMVQLHQDVRLGDVANVSGDGGSSAEALSNTVIIADAEKSERIKTDDILMALVSQGGGADGASLQISGAAECQITVQDSLRPATTTIQGGVQTPMVAMLSPAGAVGQTTAPQTRGIAASSPDSLAPAVDGTSTLEELIRARVQKELSVPNDDISIRFNTISPLLDHPLAPGTKWLCRPLTRTFLGTVNFEAQLVEGTKVLNRVNVETTVEQMQMVPVSTTRLGRGDIITADAIKMERISLDRKMPNLFANAKDVVGLECQKDLDVGTMLDNRDFRPAYMAHKNEPLTVVYVAGSLSVQMRGRALGDAKLHEQVRIQNEVTREEYAATMIGKGLAVAGATLTSEEEAKIREGMQP